MPSQDVDSTIDRIALGDPTQINCQRPTEKDAIAAQQFDIPETGQWIQGTGYHSWQSIVFHHAAGYGDIEYAIRRMRNPAGKVQHLPCIGIDFDRSLVRKPVEPGDIAGFAMKAHQAMNTLHGVERVRGGPVQYRLAHPFKNNLD